MDRFFYTLTLCFSCVKEFFVAFAVFESLFLSWLAEAKETDSQMLEQMIQATAGLGDAQVSAILMDARHKKLGAQAGGKPKPRVRTFEL